MSKSPKKISTVASQKSANSGISANVANVVKGIEPKGQVKSAFSAMHRHADVIQRALLGPIDAQDKEASQGISDLVAMHVLMPYDEGSYHLNPNLRNYLLDLLNSFSASEALTRLSGTIGKIKTQFREVQYLEGQGETEDAERIETTIDFSVNELIHTCERNLDLVNAQLSSDYGNVKSLKAKLRQNVFYQRQVHMMLTEYQSIEPLLDTIDLVGQGPHCQIQMRVKRMLVSRLGSRRLQWFKRLNDVQSEISRRRFKNKILAQRLLNLSKVSLWLTQNPTISGIDVEFPDGISLGLVLPEAIKLKSHIDLTDQRVVASDKLRTIMDRLPPKTDPFAKKVKDEDLVNLVSQTTMSVVEEVVEPIDQMIFDLVAALKDETREDLAPISLKDWQPEVRIAQGVDVESWLLYAATQLAASKIDIDYKTVARPTGYFNETFEDVMALPFRLSKKTKAPSSSSSPLSSLKPLYSEAS